MTGPVQRAMTEAIESVASSEARVAILIRALARAGLTKVPERGPEVLRFLEGAWRDSLSESLGEEIADELLGQLRPLLRFAARPPSTAPKAGSVPPPRRGLSSPQVTAQRAESPARRPSLTPEALAAVARAPSITPNASQSVRPTIPADALSYAKAASPEAMMQAIQDGQRDPETLEPGPPESGTHAVAQSHYILISRDEALADAMEAQFASRFHCARGLMEILEIADELRGRATTFVFDSIHAPVHIASLIMLTPDLPADAKFVVLGASHVEQEALASSSVERAAHWVHLPRAALARDVIAALPTDA